MSNKNQTDILLEKLVTSLVPKENLPPAKEDYLGILKKSLLPNYTLFSTNEGSILNLIEQKMEEAGQAEKIVSMNYLYTQFKKKKIINNHWACLYCLNSLARFEEAKQIKNADLFASLYLTESKIEKKPFSEIPLRAEVSSEIVYSDLELKITEKELISDLIYVIQGIEGKYIFYNKSTERHEPKLRFSNRTTEIILEIAELGWIFKKIIENEKHLHLKSKESVIIQAFIAALHLEINSYYKFLANLKTMNSNENAVFTLKTFLLYSMETKDNLTLLAQVVESLIGLSGVNVISQIYSYLVYLGDSIILKNLIAGSAGPFYASLTEWVVYGEVYKKFGEFFVKIEEKVADDAIWFSRYSIELNNVPTFLDAPVIKDIFEIGKAINFLKVYCEEKNFSLLLLRDKIQRFLLTGQFFCGFSNSDMEAFCESVRQIESINKREYELWDLRQLAPQFALARKVMNAALLDVMKTKFHVADHLTAIYKYILLGQGDMINYLMSLLIKELSKPASHIHKHNLLSMLDSSIKASNAQYHDPALLKNIEIVLFDAKRGETGWDVFLLDYKIAVPLTCIFSKQIMTVYKKIFNFYWNLKRIEFSQNKDVWRESIQLSHQLGKKYQKVRPYLQKSLLVNQQITHFISNFHTYITLEVLEAEWKNLNAKLEKATSLDELIREHTRFVENIKERSLLAESTSLVLSKVQTIFSLINKFNARHVIK